MRHATRSIIVLLFFLLCGAVVTIVKLYPLATRALFQPGDEALIMRAKADATSVFRDAPSQQPATFPVVMHLSDRSCVELRSHRADGAGSYSVCYDQRTGKKLEEQANTGF